MTEVCYRKCIPGTKPRDGDLSLGEMTCLDRCVAKYTHTHTLVRGELETMRGGTPVDFP